MRTIRVNYHYEPEGWTAESPDLPRWTAFGETLQEVRDLTAESVGDLIDEEAELYERYPATGNFVIVPSSVFAGPDACSSTALKTDFVPA